MPNLQPAVRALQRRRLHLRDDGTGLGSGLLATAAPAAPAFTEPFTFTETFTSTPTIVLFPTTVPEPSPVTVTVTVSPSSTLLTASTTPSSAATPAATNTSSPSYASAWASATAGAAESTSSAQSVKNEPKSKVPAGVIAVVVILILLILAGLVVLFIRRRSIGKRVRRRSNWATNLLRPTPFPPPGGDEEKQMEQANAANPKINATASFPNGVVPPLLAAVPTPPPVSYNNPGSSVTMSVPQPALLAPPGNVDEGSFGPALAGAARVDSAPVAIVRCTFVPTLPDELSITAGELVRVISEFDDGWALCETAARTQGMVPVECLDTGALPAPMRPSSVESSGNWRNSKRSSSLAGAGIYPSGRL